MMMMTVTITMVTMFTPSSSMVMTVTMIVMFVVVGVCGTVSVCIIVICNNALNLPVFINIETLMW